MQQALRNAVILFNLGGPDSLDSVEPFLRNLFGDPAILRLPWFLRAPLARLISSKRAPLAREIYAEMGGSSPILANTRAQAEALQDSLADLGEVAVFPVMRYWQPRAETVAREVAAFEPDRLVLLPLYPQYSSTTSGSSLKEWEAAARAVGLGDVPAHGICCYPDEPGFLAELAGLIAPRLERARAAGRPRLLLSAHGLPERIVTAGDPYREQVERTAEALRHVLAVEDLVVCYQSRVGRLKWIEPATIDEVRRAGREGRPVVLAPVAFVSEHSETLVELDVELAREAEVSGVPLYLRVPTVDTGAQFIEGLAGLVRCALSRGPGLSAMAGQRICSADRVACPLGMSPPDNPNPENPTDARRGARR